MTALALVRRSRVPDVLSRFVDSGVGRTRTLSVEAYLVATMVNGMRQHHVAHLVGVTKVLNSLTPSQRWALGMRSWTASCSYMRVARMFWRISEELDKGHFEDVDGLRCRIDAEWVANRFAEASCPDDLPASSSLAIDGTDVPTWGRFQGDVDALIPDTEEGLDELAEEEVARRTKPARGKSRLKVLGIGPDGRNVYTRDTQARAGWRTATNSRSAGYYVGRELHLAVQARDLVWTDGVKGGKLGPPVPPLIRGLTLVPAGTHRGRTALRLLQDMRRRGMPIEDVIVDPGYSLARPESFLHPLHAAGVDVTFRPASHQLPPKPFSTHALLLGGQLFDARLPESLRNLLMPPRNANRRERELIEADFNRRAAYRYTPHAGPDRDGYTRWKSPFASGFLRSRELPETMRRPSTVPLVELPDGTRPPATMTVAESDLPLRQRTIAGTSAHAVSMARRLVVELVNSQLKGRFVDVDRGFVQLFGDTKILFLLGFTIAGHNMWAARSFRRAMQAFDARTASPRRRSRRRQGTYSEMAGVAAAIARPTNGGRDPPEG
jgi:hypothetical protein